MRNAAHCSLVIVKTNTNLDVLFCKITRLYLESRDIIIVVFLHESDDIKFQVLLSRFADFASSGKKNFVGGNGSTNL